MGDPSRYKDHPRVGSKNVGDMLRKKEQQSIDKENEILARRLRSTEPVYKKKTWNRDWKNHIKIMNERMKRHAVRVHGPRMAEKLEERKYLGKHRSYSDLAASERSFDTLSEFTDESSTARTNTTTSTESYYTESTRNSTYMPPSGRRSNRSCSTRSRVSGRRASPKSRLNAATNGKKEEKSEETYRKRLQAKQEKIQTEIQESCFSLEHLHQAINPNIPEIKTKSVSSTNVATEKKMSDPEEVSDWE